MKSSKIQVLQLQRSSLCPSDSETDGTLRVGPIARPGIPSAFQDGGNAETQNSSVSSGGSEDGKDTEAVISSPVSGKQAVPQTFKSITPPSGRGEEGSRDDGATSPSNNITTVRESIAASGGSGSLIRQVDAALEQSIEFALAYDDFGMMKEVRQTEVTFITAMAGKLGYKGLADESWANFGQGAPETGEIEGAPAREWSLQLTKETMEYGPVAGITKLRKKIAAYYNLQYIVGRREIFAYFQHLRT